MSTSVIIADDHKILRDGLRNLLEAQSGIQVAGEASNGRDTVKLVKKLSPDVVIMDVAMPDLNGVEATRQIRELELPTKILALSMHSDSRYIKGMLEAGASGYMLKDCAAEELTQALQTVVANRIYVSPGVQDLILTDYVKQISGDVVVEGPVLSAREREVLQLVAEGNSTAETAERLHVSTKTIETHRKRVMDKLNLKSIAELTKYAIREGITSLDS